MKTVRNIHGKPISKLFFSIISLLFIFSVSVHNHKINVSPDASAKVSHTAPAAGHSVEGCSACLLHGNIKLSSADTVVNVIDAGLYITFVEFEDLIPLSFSSFDKPSRAPPAV